MVQRSRSSGGSEGTASDTTGNLARRRVWKMAGAVGVYKELVEGEAGRPDVRHERGQPVDAVGDLVNVCSQGGLLSEW